MQFCFQFTQFMSVFFVISAKPAIPSGGATAAGTWSCFQIGIRKAQALALIDNQPDGTFVIRSSETVANRFVACLLSSCIRILT
jgi:hypothetical protein